MRNYYNLTAQRHVAYLHFCLYIVALGLIFLMCAGVIGTYLPTLVKLQEADCLRVVRFANRLPPANIPTT